MKQLQCPFEMVLERIQPSLKSFFVDKRNQKEKVCGSPKSIRFIQRELRTSVQRFETNHEKCDQLIVLKKRLITIHPQEVATI